jgi:hypothetical protein
MGEVLKPRRWRPPDTKSASVANARQGKGDERENKGTSGTAAKYTSRGPGATTPRAEVRPFGNIWATYIRGADGTETRRGIFQFAYNAAVERQAHEPEVREVLHMSTTCAACGSKSREPRRTYSEEQPAVEVSSMVCADCGCAAVTIAPQEPERRAASPELGESDHEYGEPRVVAIYNGLDHLGNVCIGRSIRAVTPDGIEIGVFPTEAEARKAVVRTAFGMGA